MSKKPKSKIYNKDDINKKILAKTPHVHSDYEFIGSQNKYRDEEYEIYQKKKREFYCGVKKYKNLNKIALLNNKDKLDIFSIDILRYLPNDCECQNVRKSMGCTDDEPNLTGVLLRQRTVRPIHEINIEQVEVCSLEPWFKRYLKLCRFIQAARTIILKNRLLKNLNILKGLNEETVVFYEKQYRKFDNVSYSELFAKYID